MFTEINTWYQYWLDALGLTAFWSANKRIYWLYLLAAFAVASAYYYLVVRPKGGKTSIGLLAYLFPSNIWLHRSALVDYKLFLFNNVLKALLITPYLILNVTAAYWVSAWWQLNWEVQAPLDWSATSINLTYTLVFLLVSDWSRFILHFALHKIPFLWRFHQVHHAAEVLTPITLYRVHPVEMLLFRLRSLVVFAVVAGSFFFWFQTQLAPWNILQIHGVLFLFNLLVANLRHSHIPLSFGPHLEHLFISPAQHQIHHGRAERFHDSNFGSLLAIWDWLAGSLRLSKTAVPRKFGLDPKEQNQWRSFWQNLWRPFRP